MLRGIAGGFKYTDGEARDDMRYLRITGEPDPELAPEAFRIIAASEHVREARLEAYNLGGENLTQLHRIEGDLAATRRSLAEAAVVESVTVSHVGESTGYLLLQFDPSKAVFADRLFDLLATSTIVVLTPAVYREGTVHLQLVGENAEIQAIMDHLPPSLDVAVHEISGTVPQQKTAVERLSDRQHEALRVALAIGYYDQPRQATHEDVADRLGCAPSTASEHLRKAEAALVRATIVGRTE